MLGDLFVSAIMRREHEIDIKQSTERLIVLNKLFSINNNAEDLSLLFETVIEISSMFIHFPKAAIFNLTDTTIRINQYRNLDENEIKNFEQLTLQDPLFSEIYNSKSCQMIPNYANLPYSQKSHVIFPHEKFAMINLPLLDGNEVIGWITLMNDVPYEFSRNDKAMFTTIIYELNSVITRIRAKKAIHQSLQEKEILLKEIHHRVKNNLQIISGILYLQAYSLTDNKILKLFKDCQNRIHSMALVHEHLYKSESLATINVKKYVSQLIDKIQHSFTSSSLTLEIIFDIDNLEFSIDTAIPCGLIINEIITNSMKYGFPDRDEGEISISIKKTKFNQVSMILKDSGIGFPKDFSINEDQGLGTQLITTLTEQLHGVIEMSSDNGAKTSIVFPLEK